MDAYLRCSQMPLSDDQSLDMYVQAVEAEAKSQVCARHLSGFAAEFERRYQAWRRANAEALAKGALLAEAKGMNRTGGPNLRSFAQMEADVLESIPSDDRQCRCDELLGQFDGKEPEHSA
jgi:post-segregation antitoxin (ccd killing protein)